jgi:hypothetical protein
MNATVHFGQEYNNAFWNGEQMVFGDGDGDLFKRFTISLDVIGHDIPAPLMGEGRGGGEASAPSPHPNLPPLRGEGVFTYPSQPTRGEEKCRSN